MQLEKEVSNFQNLQKEYGKAVENREHLESQLKENEMVLQEMKLLKEDSKIYKLIGPLLMLQEKEEAFSNVEKRLDFIKGEIKRSESLIQDISNKQDKKREEIISMQKKLNAK